MTREKNGRPARSAAAHRAEENAEMVAASKDRLRSVSRKAAERDAAESRIQALLAEARARATGN